MLQCKTWIAIALWRQQCFIFHLLVLLRHCLLAGMTTTAAIGAQQNEDWYKYAFLVHQNNKAEGGSFWPKVESTCNQFLGRQHFLGERWVFSRNLMKKVAKQCSSHHFGELFNSCWGL